MRKAPPSTNDEFAVQVQNVSKRFSKVQALTEVSVNIQPGEVIALLGHNGAGKSTLMKLILGLIHPTHGSVRTLNHQPDKTRSHSYRRQFGYLPENVCFYDQLSGLEVLNYFAKLKGFKHSDALQLLEEVGLAHASKRPVKTYSKGMRQRLGLAQALIGDPKLLVLDEPTVGLDPVATRDFYLMVDRLKSHGSAVILCTHVLQGVEQHIDRAMIMGGGKALAIGDINSLRQTSKLPTKISFYSADAQKIRQSYGDFCLENNSDHSTHIETIATLFVPHSEKMALIRQISNQYDISDLEINPPSLQDIYEHFMNQFDQQSAQPEPAVKESGI